MKKELSYIALLRGINVGGNNLIKMTDLKSTFEEMGFSDVLTYIQSGNVLFKATDSHADTLTEKIEKALTKRFTSTLRVVVISEKQLKEVVEKAPRGFGKESDKYRYDVMFLKSPLTAGVVLKSVSPNEGVDIIHPGKDVVYFSRLIKKATQSKLNRVAALPIYQNMTIRNWNTTTKLQGLMEAF